jgi:uncharacterized membrane protein
MVAKLWVHVELITFMACIPYTFFIGYQIGALQKLIGSCPETKLKADDIMITHVNASETSLTTEQKANFDIYQSQQDKLQAELKEYKKTLEFEEDFTMMTVLGYLKENKDKWLLGPMKQSQMLYSCILVQTVVIMMLTCMLYAINTNENCDYTPNVAHSFAVWIVKFPCAVALHFFLYPEVANGMAVMKFAN